MWHEARRNEKKIKGMIVDHKKRAERRRHFYEKIRRDPVEFLQVHGSKMKINVESNIGNIAENSLVPWRGDESNMIDRFDVRAHLDVIPTCSKESDQDSEPIDDRLHYERWRTLITNDFTGVEEDRALQFIELQERFGETKRGDLYKDQKDLKKKSAQSKSAIGYTYDINDSKTSAVENEEESSSEEPDLEETNVDLETLSSEQILQINAIANRFGVRNDYFMKLMEEDRIEAEEIKRSKAREEEKSMFSVRKARRQRRNSGKKRSLIVRTIAPLVMNEDGDDVKKEDSDSSSESEIEMNSRPEFITSFGGSSEDETVEKPVKKSWLRNSNDKSKVSRNASRSIKSALESIDSSPKTISTKFKERNSRSFIPRDSNRRRDRSRSSSRSRDRNRDRGRSKSRDRTRRYRSRSRSHSMRSRSRRRSRHKSSRRRSRDRDQKRSRSRDRKNRRSIQRSKSKERRHQSRSRSASVDEFGRKKDLRKIPSPEPEKIDPVIKAVSMDIVLPPPPVKKYYRPELDKGSDSELEEIKAELESEG